MYRNMKYSQKHACSVGYINIHYTFSQLFAVLTSSSLSSFLSLPFSPIRSSSGTSWVRLTLLSSGGRSTWGMSNLRDKSGHSATCCCSKGAIWKIEEEKKTTTDKSGHSGLCWTDQIELSSNLTNDITACSWFLSGYQVHGGAWPHTKKTKPAPICKYQVLPWTI